MTVMDPRMRLDPEPACPPEPDLQWSLLALLDAHKWSGTARMIADALPAEGRIGSLAELRDVLGNLGFVSRLERGRPLDRLTARSLPALAWVRGRFLLIESIDPSGQARVRWSGLGDAAVLGLRDVRGDVLRLRRAQRMPARIRHEDGLRAGLILRRFRREYLAVLFLTLGSYMLGVVPAVFIVQIYDRVLQERSLATLLALLIPTAAAVILDAVLRYARGRVLNTLGSRLSFLTTGHIFAGFLSLPLGVLERMRLGVKVQRLQQTETVRETFAGAAATTLIELPFALVFIIALGAIAGPLAIVPVATLTLYGVVGWFAGDAIRRSANVAGRAVLQRQDFLFETVAHLREVSLAGAGERWSERHDALSSGAAAAGYVAVRTGALVQALGQTITVAAGTTMIAWGAYRVMEGAMTMGALAGVMTLTWRAMTPLQSAFLLLTRLDQIRGTIGSLDQAVRGGTDDEAHAHTDIPPATCGQVVVSKLSFRYSADLPPALLNLNLRIEPGEVVAITGPNGAGKSTLLKLILGLYVPQAGSIRLDGIDVRQHAPSALRQAIGYAPQGSALFSGTLRDNLRMADPTASPTDVDDAVRRAWLGPALSGVEGGLDLLLAPGAPPLPDSVSAGMALAGAYLRDSRLLLIDEAADQLQGPMRAAFAAEIERLRGDVTIMVVTRCPDLLHRADRIVIMDEGAILRSGSPRALLAATKDTP